MSRLEHAGFRRPGGQASASPGGWTAGADGIPRLRLGREICGDLAALEAREWLVTNGIGGYASASLAGSLTRGYHGLLVAALQPPVGRTLLLANLVETVRAEDRTWSLATLRWHDGTVAPQGWTLLRSVTFDGTVPVWRFATADFVIDKTVFMEPGANVTRIDYEIVEARVPLDLTIEALTDFRDYHGRSFSGEPLPAVIAEGSTLRVEHDGAADAALHMSCSAGRAETVCQPYRDFDLAKERARGLTDREDHLLAGRFRLSAGQGARIQCTASAGHPVAPDPDARTRLRHREARLVEQFGHGLPASPSPAATPARPSASMPTPRPDRDENVPAWVARLALAADQFVVARPLADGTQGHSVIAGYHWFADWGRDTMIALPGLTHACGRPEIAASILESFAEAIDGGMIPNRFTDDGSAPEFNTVDATFWFVEAVGRHWHATGDDAFLRRMMPRLMDIVDALEAGTRYGIALAADGLVTAGAPGVQLTWMDARIGDWVVTPRIGKPIEVNALWLGGLAFLVEAARRTGGDVQRFETLRSRARAAFERFWNPETGHAFDVLDGPEGNDPSLRPNQILAAPARLGLFDEDRRRAIVETCAASLLTPAGLRSLAPRHPDYRPHYGGDQSARDAAYHQGTVWPWLIGPFVEAHLDVHADPARTARLLEPLADQLVIECIGTVGEIFEAEPPHAPRGAVAQAWSVGEILRAWRLLEAARNADPLDMQGTAE